MFQWKDNKEEEKHTTTKATKLSRRNHLLTNVTQSKQPRDIVKVLKYTHQTCRNRKLCKNYTAKHWDHRGCKTKGNRNLEMQ